MTRDNVVDEVSSWVTILEKGQAMYVVERLEVWTVGELAARDPGSVKIREMGQHVSPGGPKRPQHEEGPNPTDHGV